LPHQPVQLRIKTQHRKRAVKWQQCHLAMYLTHSALRQLCVVAAVVVALLRCNRSAELARQPSAIKSTIRHISVNTY
jgi:hypothetical protein